MARLQPIIRSLRQLNLSGEQRVKLRNLARQTGNQVQVLNQLQRAQSNAWEEALYANDFDPKVTERRAADLANTQMELNKLQFSVMAQIRQILTPEQALRFRELLEEERKPQNGGPPDDSPTKSKEDLPQR